MIVGLGTDIVEIGRIERSLGRYGRRFSDRLLSGEEQALASGREGAALSQFVAGRFAAKEAIFKAMGTGLGDARWSDISVDRDARGKPVASLHGVAAARAAGLGATRVHVSISHSHHYAVAQAILEAIEGEEVLGDEASKG